MLDLFPSIKTILFGDTTADYENHLSKKHIAKFKRILCKYSTGPLKGPTIEKMMLRWIIKDDTASMECRKILDLMPITSFSNPILRFTERSPSKKQHIQFIEFLDTMRQNMMIGVKKEITIPKVICARLITELENFIQTKAYIVPSVSQNFLHNTYRPKLKEFVEFLKTTYFPACRDSIGVCSKSMYKQLLRSYTTMTNVTPQQIHAIGLQEIAKFKAKKADGSAMATLNDFKDMQLVIEKNVIPENFDADVKRCNVVGLSKSLQNTAPAAMYYVGRGEVHVNTARKIPVSSVLPLMLHECKPGHHFQYEYMRAINVPLYKMYSVRSVAFTEGWGLYAESLVSDKSNAYDILRSARLVLDTGIHWYGWSYEQAMEFMRQHVPMSEEELVAEVERCISRPGQVVAYRMGALKFWELRKLWEGRFGTGRIREFHRCCLEDGVLPMCVLERKISKLVRT